VVNAVGHQWYWQIEPERVKAGTPVEFRVSAEDVTHGFALYDADLKLVTQTQAMPGYTNVLTHVFEKPGKYRVLCLEYCGVSHHGMMAELIVE
jgi:cytochrome c oxidase subunit II